MIAFVLPLFVPVALALSEDAPAPETPAAPEAPVPAPAPAPAVAPAVAASAPATALVSLDPPTERRFEVSVFASNQGFPSSVFDEEGSRVAAGLGFRAFVTEVVSIEGGLTHSMTQNDRYFESYGGTGGDDDYYASSVEFRMISERLDVGARFTAPLSRWFEPYARIAAVGSLNAARFDEDVNDDENLTQSSVIGFTGGGYLSGGVAFPIRVRNQVHITPALEVGYTLQAPLVLGDWGTIQASGYTVRQSIAVAF